MSVPDRSRQAGSPGRSQGGSSLVERGRLRSGHPAKAAQRGRPGEDRLGLGRRRRDVGASFAGEQVEGHHAVRQLLSAQRRRARVVWADDRLAARGPVSEVVALARREGVPVELKSAGALLAAAATNAPQGVIAWADPLAAAPLEQLLEPTAGRSLLIVLDGVSDPGNLGAVLRVAACAGAGGVVVGRHRSAPLTPAALKAAAGAAEVVPVAVAPGIPAALAAVRAAGWWVVGLDPEAGDDIWGSPLLGSPVALVFGSEGKGLSRLVRKRCDAIVQVPMASAGAVGSLNVAAACAVACFEVARRRAAVSRSPLGTGRRAASSGAAARSPA